MLDAIEKIQRFTHGLDLEGFRSDAKTRDAVIRNLTVIGEAALHLPETVKTAQPGIPWREMQGIRNIVVHEYFGVSDEILWETIQTDLPALLAPLRALRGDTQA
jgi:uncharacterized protein with HEPN domain